MRILWPLILSAGALWAQSGSPQFDVASVKPSPPPSPGGRMGFRMSGGPGTNDPGQISWSNQTLKSILMRAYGVKAFQITAPDWVNSERYDITAKIPPDTTKEQFNLMLQNLLAERFKLALHREKKELPMYSLVVGKNGPKLKESEPMPEAAPGGGPARDGPPPMPPDPRRMTFGKDGFPELPPGPNRPSFMIMMSPGRVRLMATGQSLTQLANILENQLSRPVMDDTGLTGKYDIKLEFAPESGGAAGMPMVSGMMPPPPPPPPGGGGQIAIAGPPGGPAGETPNQEPAPSIFSAIQQLGLRLEQKRAPVDLLVVDHLEKTPTEN